MLTKNSYFDSLSASPNGTTNEIKNREYGESDTVDKSLQMTDLGIDKEPMSPHDIDLEPNTPERTRTSDLRIRKMSFGLVSPYQEGLYSRYFSPMQENSSWVVGQ